MKNIISKEKKLIDLYFKIKDDLFIYFKYIEDYCIFPLEDRRHYKWYYKEDNTKVIFWNTKELREDPTLFYSDEIYTQRFLSKWVYPTKNYTMMLVDTHTDGNKLLVIFDNKKKEKLPKSIKTWYEENGERY